MPIILFDWDVFFLSEMRLWLPSLCPDLPDFSLQSTTGWYRLLAALHYWGAVGLWMYVAHGGIGPSSTDPRRPLTLDVIDKKMKSCQQQPGWVQHRRHYRFSFEPKIWISKSNPLVESCCRLGNSTGHSRLSLFVVSSLRLNPFTLYFFFACIVIFYSFKHSVLRDVDVLFESFSYFDMSTVDWSTKRRDALSHTHLDFRV